MHPKIDAFVRQYVETALWSSTDNADDSGGEPLDKNYTIDDLAPETLEAMIADCDKFRHENANDIGAVIAKVGPYGHKPIDETDVAHDFWLTRNRHGCGFWDGNYPEPFGERLTEASKKFGEVSLYVGDDGKIHMHG